MRRVWVLVCLAILAAACGGSSSQTTTGAAAPTTVAPGGGQASAPTGASPAHPNQQVTRAAATGSGSSSPVPVKTKAGSSGTKSATQPSPAASPAQPGVAFPKAGQYTYKQNGTENFCQGQACTTDNLPPSMTTTIQYTHRSKTGGTIVLTSKPSDRRTDRITIAFDSHDAGVTKVVSEFTVTPFHFVQSFSPDPPMQVLRFPLQTGARWSGSWSGSTSGKYSVHVLGTEKLTVAGHTITAYRIERTLDLSGDVQGHDSVTTWFDPSTGIIVKSIDEGTFQNQNGTYHTKSTTQLSSGPGY